MEKFGLLEADYIDTGMVRYIAYPYNLGRPEMALAVEAAWCAQDQGQFFEYQHALYENQGLIPYNNSSFIDLAAEIGLDQEAFSECLTSRQHQGDVENARRAAINRGVSSTPTFFINDRRVEGNQPYEIFQTIIDQEIAESQ